MNRMVHVEILEECHLPGGSVVHLRGVLTYFVDPPAFPSYDDPGSPGSRPEPADGELKIGVPVDNDVDEWLEISFDSALLLLAERLDALAEEAERMSLGVPA